jgi:uncharacterized membrane protein
VRIAGARTGLHYFPLAAPLLIVLFLVLAALVGLIEMGAITYAYERLGIRPRAAAGILLGSLVGSYVNIPVAVLPAERVVSGRIVTFFGARYVVPVAEDRPRTIVAVNLGGAVVPVLVSLYLLRPGMLLKSLVGIALVGIVTHAVAQPVQGVGIAVPMFVAPLVAAGVGLVLSRDAAPAVAYCAGTVGTLLGADLLNLGKLRGLGAPVASIGGAGTFDGIFLTGILAVLLA